MASAFGHAFAACGITKSIAKEDSLVIYISAIALSVLPDLDVIAFNFGIPYESPYGHRGFSHSIVFSLSIAFIITISIKVAKNEALNYRYFFIFFFSTISHSILDMFTNGGLGVALFWPFDNQRYFAPYRPIEVSPISIRRFFSDWGIRVLISEAIFIGIPLLSIYLINRLQKLFRK